MAQLSEQAIKALTDFIEAEGRKWARLYIVNRQKSLRKRGITTSGQLQQSLGSEVSSQLQGVVTTSIELEFEDYGRLIDMTRLKPPSGGGDYISFLEDWIVRKGLQQKFISGFMRKRKLKAEPQNVLNQIAWGIAVKRTQKYRRRSPWFAKSKTAAVTDLYNRVAAGLPDIVADEIKNAFQHFE